MDARFRVEPLHQLMVLLVVILFLHQDSAAALSLSFNYPTMGADASIQDYLTYMGNVSFNPDDVELTVKNNAPFQSTGRIYNADQLFLWDSATQEAASFNCSFTLSIVPINVGTPPADGLAFFLLDPKLSDVPDDRKGSGLGLPLDFLGFVAVEFDTFLNSGIDNSDNHIGIDINSVVSANYSNLTFGLPNSSFVYSWVDFSSSKSLLEMYATNLSSTKPTSPVLTYSINLTQFLPEHVLIGFSAGTGGKAAYHRIFSWSFNSTSVGKEKGSNVSLIAGLSSTGTLVVGMVILVLFLCQKRRRSRRLRRQRTNHPLPSGVHLSNGLPSPSKADLGLQKFDYRYLSMATNNFGDDCLLGRGGSGSVYRGLLPDNGTEVAVKCISQKSTDGEREFFAEVSIISRIRHKNLVQLKGWCRDKSINLLLVYEYMPNGSLDRSLFNQTSSVILDWSKRYNILCGLGSALQYLHQECERVIVHRDIKASNVMLDANYNAKLGDFGLARQLGEGVDGHTTHLAGTLGYMAPETYRTGRGRATTMSDVYSYGMVLLEVGRLREACDSRLEGDTADGGEVAVRTLRVGLACLHPDPKMRPSIQVALDALEGRGALPLIPTLQPVVSYGPLYKTSTLSAWSTISSSAAATHDPIDSSATSSSAPDSTDMPETALLH
ncbi:hypothetical protein GOP47_0016953 [Adiantum capillus-veneris]|uniref:non-specific serine/threonine protein kinase n=1 Tax=Adiantum capillus-veneris TaxID=13818 RepID=A0A9D4UIM8_ADICA|nr:hypothetical protein GOP47_0016953 [Adiantum capillus-veneris]